MREIYFNDDLAKMIRHAERARKWYWRLDWHFIGGVFLCITVSGLAWWGIIEAVIYANGWFQ